MDAKYFFRYEPIDPFIKPKLFSMSPLTVLSVSIVSDFKMRMDLRTFFKMIGVKNLPFKVEHDETESLNNSTLCLV